MKKSYPLPIYLLIILGCVILFSSCKSPTSSKVPTEVQFGFKIKNLNKTLISPDGNDTLKVNRFRFINGGANLLTNYSNYRKLESNFSSWRSYSVTANKNPVLLFPKLHFEPADNYELVLGIHKALHGNDNIDADFTSGQHAAMIFEGIYNGKHFRLKGKYGFAQTLDATNTNIQKYGGSYVLLITTNVRSWFKGFKKDGHFLNPFRTPADDPDPDPAVRISGNLSHSLKLIVEKNMHLQK